MPKDLVIKYEYVESLDAEERIKKAFVMLLNEEDLFEYNESDKRSKRKIGRK